MSENNSEQGQQTSNPNPGAEGQGGQDQGGQGHQQQGGAGQGGEQPFYSGFTDESLRTDPSVQKFKSTEDLARGYVNAVKRLGADPGSLVKLPTSADDVEGHAAIFKALGAPETAEGYQINMEGASEADIAAAKEFAADMHAKGPFPPQFVAAATAWFNSKVMAQNAALLQEAEAMTAAGQAELKAAWGQAYEHRTAELGKLINDLGGKELADELNGTTFGDNPKLAIFLGKVLDRLAEPGPRNERGDVGGGVMTPDQAKAKARELEAHPAFRDKGHPQHAEILRQRNDALRAAEAKAA